MQTSQNTLTLHLGEQRSNLWINASITDTADAQLSLGWGNVLPGPLRTSPPRPLDLENAIENIEEQVMPLARIMPVGASLSISCVGDGAPSLLSLMQEQAESHNAYHLDNIESVFSRLCAIAEGSPAREDNPLIEPSTVAALLIVREFMHHSGLTQVSIA